jgi:hypothetical protein
MIVQPTRHYAARQPKGKIMLRPSRLFAALLLLLVVSMSFVAACGGDDDDGEDGNGSATPATSEPAGDDGDDGGDDGDGNGADADYLTEVTAIADSGMELLAGFLPYAALEEQRMILDEITAAVAGLDPPDEYAEGHDLLERSIEAARVGVEYQESLDSFGGDELSQTAEYFSESSDLYYDARAELGID